MQPQTQLPHHHMLEHISTPAIIDVELEVNRASRQVCGDAG